MRISYVACVFKNAWNFENCSLLKNVLIFKILFENDNKYSKFQEKLTFFENVQDLKICLLSENGSDFRILIGNLKNVQISKFVRNFIKYFEFRKFTFKIFVLVSQK